MFSSYTAECYTPQSFVTYANNLFAKYGYLYRLTDLKTDENGMYVCYIDHDDNVRVLFNGKDKFSVFGACPPNHVEIAHRLRITNTILMQLIGLSSEEQMKVDMDKGHWSYYKNNGRARQMDVWCDKTNCYIRQFIILGGISCFSYEILYRK